MSIQVVLHGFQTFIWKVSSFLAELQTSVQLSQVNASSVTDCSFVGLPGHSLSIFGIKDLGTQTGNRFVNDTFDGTQATALSLGGGPVFINLVLDCYFQPTP
jgi:hypothetical protein